MNAYLQQVARAFRFLDRLKAGLTWHFERDPNRWNELEDNLLAFFQNCWHIKDWIRNDETLNKDLRDRIWEEVKGTKFILVAADLANGSKHLRNDPKREWTGAGQAPSQVRRNADGTWTFEPYVLLDEGTYVPALEVAEQAMREWQEILKRNGLHYFIDPGAPAA